MEQSLFERLEKKFKKSDFTKAMALGLILGSGLVCNDIKGAIDIYEGRRRVISRISYTGNQSSRTLISNSYELSRQEVYIK